MPPRPRLSMLALLLAVVAAAAPAQATPRCEGTLPMSEIGSRQEATLVLLREKRYDELQQRMDGFLAAWDARRIGDEELFYEFGAFDRWGPFLTPLMQEWIARHPASYAAHHAMALHLSSRAWQARGTALGRDTSDAQMQGFDRDLAAARDMSLKAIKLHPRPLLSYQQLVKDAKARRLPDTTLAGLLGTVRATLKADPLQPRPDVLPLLEAAQRIQPDNVIVRHAYIGVLAPRWGGSLDALQDYARPARHPGLSPDRVASVSYGATMEIASDYWFRKQPDQAVEVLEVAAKLCRLNQPWVDIANIRLEQQRHAEALQAADQTIAIVPTSSSGHLLRARALRGLGRHDEAVRVLQRLAPDGMAEVAYLLGEYHESGSGGLPRDAAEARRLYEIAARGGEARALKKLQAPAK